MNSDDDVRQKTGMSESGRGRLHQLRVFLSLLPMFILMSPLLLARWLMVKPYRRLVPFLFVELVLLGGVGVSLGVL